MRNKSLFWLCIIVVTCLSVRCTSNALSREEAEQKIKEFYHYPYVTSEMMYVVAFRNKVTSNMRVLLNKDLVAFNGWEDYEKNLMYYSPTEKGKQYLMSDKWAADGNPYGRKLDFVTHCVTFDSITGITAQENTTVVEYTCKRIGCTPFGNLKGYYDGTLEKKTATFQKYDNGWRLVDNAQSYAKPSKFPFFTQSGEYKNDVDIQESLTASNTASQFGKEAFKGKLIEVIAVTGAETLYNISGNTVECNSSTVLVNVGSVAMDNLPIGETFEVTGTRDGERIIANKLIRL